VELSNSNIEVARSFHDATKHSYTSVRTGVHFLDWDNKPLVYKIYPDAPALALPRELELPRMPALAALHESVTQGAASENPIDLEGLTKILFCAGGLTRHRRVGGEDYHFRAAPSAGALYPIEIYVASADIEGLEAGLYHFSPADLKLRTLRDGDWRGFLAWAAGERPALRGAGAIIVLSAIFWRSTWKYRARGYRYCYWDAGTILANLLAAASAERVGAQIVTSFADPQTESFLGIDGEREGAVCLVALGRTKEAVNDQREISPLLAEAVPLSREEVTYRELIEIHRASRLPTAEAAAALAVPSRPSGIVEGGVVTAPLAPIGSGTALGETIMRRGSTRAFARDPITKDELMTILSASSSHPCVDFPSLTDTYLIVNAVAGIEPGAYAYRRDDGSLEAIKPGDFRAEAGYLCLEQPLGADCSALLCFMADLDRALSVLGNRGYRHVHLESGILGGRAYLAAYALGRGATGLTFYDDDTTEFFSPYAAGKSPILMVALGVPRSRGTESTR
jgi:SagB-type dehydrogenase family enzyme